MPALIHLLLDCPPGLDTYPARLHGAACALLERRGAVHNAQVKNFAVAPLRVAPHDAVWRLGWLPDAPPPAVRDRVVFGDVTCTVLDHRVDHHSYLQLASAPPIRSAELQVTSPMYFSRNGRDHPLPDPVLVLRNLISRWNHHAPERARIEDSDARDLISHIHLAEFDGHTARARTTYTAYQTGFLGTFSLALPAKAPTRTNHTLAALITYAPTAGLGAQTTHGYGTCRIVQTTPR